MLSLIPRGFTWFGCWTSGLLLSACDGGAGGRPAVPATAGETETAIDMDDLQPWFVPSAGRAAGSSVDSAGAARGGPVLAQPASVMPAGTPACVSEVQQAQPVTVDMFFMLDRSASMTERTRSGQTKWEAVGEAFAAFLSDERSAGLNVNLQYYPLGNPGIPEVCERDEDCGGAGPCARKACLLPEHAAGILLCDDDADCPTGGSCQPLGQCSRARHRSCGLGNAGCGADGDCEPVVPRCLGFASCEPRVYGTQAVSVDELPAQAGRVLSSLRTTKLLSTTPTGPALAGALNVAQMRADSALDHQVVVVLVTDGMPTACAPDTAAGIADLAAQSFARARAVPTYVVGVFSEDDSVGATNSQRWARAGGTDHALNVDTEADVATQFLDALEEIRLSSVQCDYALPQAPPRQTLDFGYVNVAFVDDDARLDLLYVGDAGRCGETAAGWHYDVAPESAQRPTRIVLCPAICARLRAEQGGRLETYLGCQTEAPG